MTDIAKKLDATEKLINLGHRVIDASRMHNMLRIPELPALTVAEIRAKHTTAITYIAEETGLNMPTWRIHKYTGRVYNEGKEVVPSDELFMKYAKEAENVVELLGTAFPVERLAQYSQLPEQMVR